MLKPISYFKEYKNQQKNQLNNQIKVYETEDQLWFERSGHECIYTFLETETKKMPMCEDELDAYMIMRIQERQVNQDVVELHIKQGEKISIITAQFDYVEEGEVFLYATTLHEKPHYTEWGVTEEEKETLIFMYKKFRRILRDIPDYRLYFTTMNIEIDEEGIDEWLSDL